MHKSHSIVSSVCQDFIDGAGEIAQRIDIVNAVGHGSVFPHITVARSPLRAPLRAEPDQAAAFTLDVLDDIETRVVVVVAAIAQNDDGGLAGYQTHVVV